MAGGCASAMTVSSHVRPNVDFAQYRTYDWGPADALPTGDPRLDENPVFKDNLQGGIDKQLAAKGYERASSGAPDLLIHYHASVNERIDVDRADRNRGYCYDEDCQVRVFEYEEGTVVVDVVDPRTNRVIWRGWAQDTLTDLIDNPDRMRRRVEEAVVRMLSMFPSRSGQ
jgi:hypothetical protein